MAARDLSMFHQTFRKPSPVERERARFHQKDLKRRLVGSGRTGPKPSMPQCRGSRSCGTSSGRRGRPVPIMQFAGNEVGKPSSLQPSVHDREHRQGRGSGVSAVESQTRIRVAAGRVTPKSASHSARIMTVRERLGRGLVTGGPEGRSTFPRTQEQRPCIRSYGVLARFFDRKR